MEGRLRAGRGNAKDGAPLRDPIDRDWRESTPRFVSSDWSKNDGENDYIVSTGQKNLGQTIIFGRSRCAPEPQFPASRIIQLGEH